MFDSIRRLFRRKPSMQVGFGINDIVKVIDTGYIYQNYSQQARLLSKEDQLHWVYKEDPKPNHVFEIIDVMYHVDNSFFDTGKVVIAIRDLYTKQVYLVNEHAIAPMDTQTVS